MELKSKSEIDILREANLIVADVLSELEAMVEPGVTTNQLNQKAAELTKKHGAKSAFLGYPAPSPGVEAFPGLICASLNDAIVHGIPNDVPLKEGDILSVDYGCEHKGFFGDSARTIPVGDISDETQRLLDVTKASLEAAIEQCQAGNRIGDISNAVQTVVEKAGFGIVREFVGHGIGRNMHEPPHVPNFGRQGQGRVLKPGLVIAIEPMVTIGSFETKLLEDGWTAVTRDGSLAAHFEHSVAITADGPIVLSRP